MAYSEAFRKSVDLVLRVHQLMAAGKGESAETNRLRAQSEQPWYEMSDEEQDVASGLSEDLYSIGRPRSPSDAVTDDHAKSLEQYIRDRRWSEALVFLREHEKELPPDDVATLRGICWAKLDQPAVADAFFRDAISQNPLREDIRQAYSRFKADHPNEDPSAASFVHESVRAIVQQYAGVLN